ncbi:MAG: TraB/GumN family protein [Kofleriaceae bacterium]
MVRALLLVTLGLTACSSSRSPAPAGGAASGSATSAPTAITPPSPTPSSDAVVPMLYAVRKDGQTSHVLGTIDIGLPAPKLPPSVWSAFASAKAVVLEWNFGERTTGLRERMRRDGSKLSDSLTPEERTALAGAVGPGAKDLDTAATWMAPGGVSSTGLPRTDAIQAVLAARAEEQEVPVTYLESMDVQVTRTAKWLDERALRALLADVTAVRRGNLAYLEAYTRGDEAALAELRGERTPWKRAGRTGAELAQLDAETLGDRQATWMATLQPLLTAGGAFIAVDVAHLVGSPNLLARLRDAGYDVTREAP